MVPGSLIVVLKCEGGGLSLSSIRGAQLLEKRAKEKAHAVEAAPSKRRLDSPKFPCLPGRRASRALRQVWFGTFHPALAGNETEQSLVSRAEHVGGPATKFA